MPIKTRPPEEWNYRAHDVWVEIGFANSFISRCICGRICGNTMMTIIVISISNKAQRANDASLRNESDLSLIKQSQKCYMVSGSLCLSSFIKVEL